MTDIQETFSHTLHSPYGRHSVLGNPRLVTVEHKLIMLSDAAFAIFHFPMAESVSEYLKKRLNPVPASMPRLRDNRHNHSKLRPEWQAMLEASFYSAPYAATSFSARILFSF